VFACLDRRDNTGIRFYIGKELRQYDIGYISFGTVVSALALAIPPKVERFFVDSYCPSGFSKVYFGFYVFSSQKSRTRAIKS
jgi:hypothetical protein